MIDYIVIGSGPSSVAACYSLLQSEKKVLMLEGGDTPKISFPTEPFDIWKKKEILQKEWTFESTSLSGNSSKNSSPKLRTKQNYKMIEKFHQLNNIKSNNEFPIGAIVSGGLSNLWGAGVAYPSTDDMSIFPFSPSDKKFFKASFEFISQKIGISGCSEDDLSDYFGVDNYSQKTTSLDKLQNFVFEKYKKNKHKFATKNFKIGRSRLAVLSEDMNDRKGCNSCGNCFYGCSRSSIYNSRYSLEELKKNKNFYFKNNNLVKKLINSQ